VHHPVYTDNQLTTNHVQANHSINLLARFWHAEREHNVLDRFQEPVKKVWWRNVWMLLLLLLTSSCSLPSFLPFSPTAVSLFRKYSSIKITHTRPPARRQAWAGRAACHFGPAQRLPTNLANFSSPYLSGQKILTAAASEKGFEKEWLWTNCFAKKNVTHCQPTHNGRKYRSVFASTTSVTILVLYSLLHWLSDWLLLSTSSLLVVSHSPSLLSSHDRSLSLGKLIRIEREDGRRRRKREADLDVEKG
jgi:hypothetical protein